MGGMGVGYAVGGVILSVWRADQEEDVLSSFEGMRNHIGESDHRGVGHSRVEVRP